MPGFNTIPGSSGGGGQPNMSFVGSIHMSSYNRSWAQAGTAGSYGLYSANQENGFAYFVGATITGVPLNRVAAVSHSFTRIDIVAPTNDMVSLYKVKTKGSFNYSIGGNVTLIKNKVILSSFFSVPFFKQHFP